MSSQFLFTTNKPVTAACEKRINKRIKAISPDATYVTHNAAGNAVRGWIEANNDGTWSSREADHKAICQIAIEEIANSRRPR